MLQEIKRFRSKIAMLNNSLGDFQDIASKRDEFIEIEYLYHQIKDDLNELLAMYHYVDTLDDEAIMDGAKRRVLARDGDKLVFRADDDIISVLEAPQSVIGLTFDMNDGKLELEIPTIKFIQMVNGLMEEIKRYEFAKGVWLRSECGKKCL